MLPDKEGKPYTVRDDQVNAMLLNESLEEPRTVEQQKVTIAQLKQNFQSKLALQQNQICALTAGLHKVSAQLGAASPSGGGPEASNAALQVVHPSVSSSISQSAVTLHRVAASCLCSVAAL